MTANRAESTSLRHVSRLTLALAAIGAMFVAAASFAAPAATFEGQLELRQALTLYIVNEAGSDFIITMRWRQPLQTHGDWPRLIRVFDPQERLVARRFEPCERAAGEAPAYHVELPVAGGAGGVYQVVVTGFGGPLEFAALRKSGSESAALSWGVMGHPRLVGRANQFANAYICLPPGLDHLSVRWEGTVDRLQLIDDTGRPQIDVQGVNAGGSTALSGAGGEIWKLAISAPPAAEQYRLDFAGAPIILCPDAATARAIGSSIDVLADGTICFHKFQARVKEALDEYRRMPASAFVVQPPALETYRAQWLRHAARHDLLLGGAGVYSTFPLVLREQNLDASSPWFGTIKVWHDGPHLRSTPQNPWTRCDRLGVSRVSELASVLAAVYSIDEPFNPLHRDQGLRNRIIIASLQELMLIGEHEMPLRNVPDGYYGGERAFLFSRFLRSFPLVINHCPADVRAVWTEGLRRYVDHESIAQVASNCNQWSFTIKALQHFYDGTGEPQDRATVERHINWMLARTQWDLGVMPAGYFFDGGPDAVYNGITLHNLGWVYKQLQRRGSSPISDRLGQALRGCIDLFNHTIAPQPDGSILGASSFCTRTPGNWTNAQYGGGFTMLSDEFPEAAPLLGRVWPTVQSRSSNINVRRAVDKAVGEKLLYWTDPEAIWRPEMAGTVASGPELHFMIWEHFASQPLNGELPMKATAPFVRNFGDEFFCVRKPRYYSFIYAGEPLPDYLKPQRPLDPRMQHPRNGGGLSMFWSPAFGTSLLAQNWSAYAANSILMEQHSPDGIRVDWEEYWSIERTFDADRASAHVSGIIRDQPLSFERRYRFLDVGVECNLSLTSAGQVQYTAAWESFAYPSQADARLHVTLVDEAGRPVNTRPASAIVFRNASNEAHVVVFAQPRVCQLGPERVVDAYGQKREYNRVLAALPADWSPGQQRTLRWCVMVVSAAEVPRAIRAAVAAMAK